MRYIKVVLTCVQGEDTGEDPITFISLLVASSKFLRQFFNLTLEGNGTSHLDLSRSAPVRFTGKP